MGRDVGEGMADTQQSLVGRLASGEVILGDGSYIMTLEKRGYATAGSWTPEAAAEHPEAIEQLGIEFARAGADITQTFTFWAHDDALPKGCKFTCAEINQAACDTAKKVALEYGIPVAATMCIGPVGDESGIGVGECAVRMAKAGALLVGVNCLFDPFICLEVLKTMKVA